MTSLIYCKGFYRGYWWTAGPKKKKKACKRKGGKEERAWGFLPPSGHDAVRELHVEIPCSSQDPVVWGYYRVCITYPWLVESLAIGDQLDLQSVRPLWRWECESQSPSTLILPWPFCWIVPNLLGLPDISQLLSAHTYTKKTTPPSTGSQNFNSVCRETWERG